MEKKITLIIIAFLLIGLVAGTGIGSQIFPQTLTETQVLTETQSITLTELSSVITTVRETTTEIKVNTLTVKEMETKLQTTTQSFFIGLSEEEYLEFFDEKVSKHEELRQRFLDALDDFTSGRISLNALKDRLSEIGKETNAILDELLTVQVPPKYVLANANLTKAYDFLSDAIIQETMALEYDSKTLLDMATVSFLASKVLLDQVVKNVNELRQTPSQEITIITPQTETVTLTKTLTVTKTVGGWNYTGKVIILSHHAYIDSLGYLNILGEVQNQDDAPHKFVKIIATIYDKDGNVLDVVSTYSKPSDLEPGQKAAFKITIIEEYVVNNYDHYKLQVSYD